MILCCGEALIDMVPYKTPEGIATFQPIPGGSPYNSAIALGRLETPVAFMGRISEDFFGELLLNRLVSNKVRTDFIVRSNQPTTLAFVKIDPGKEPQYAFYTEGTADRSFSEEDVPKILPPEVHGILFGSISLTMEPIATTIEGFVHRQSQRTDVAAPVISLDPNIRPIMITDPKAYVKRLEGWIADATIVKISAADLEFVYPSLNLDQALEKVLSLGPTLVVTTLGSHGSLAMGRRRDNRLFRVTSPGVSVQVVDTIGAGDTFHAGLLSWLERKGKLSRRALSELSEAELAEALLFANKAAALVCTRAGAEPPTLEEVNRFSP